jgi:hypothetical protein
MRNKQVRRGDSARVKLVGILDRAIEETQALMAQQPADSCLTDRYIKLMSRKDSLAWDGRTKGAAYGVVVGSWTRPRMAKAQQSSASARAPETSEKHYDI